MITEIIFWTCIIFVFYAYFGYPLLLMILSLFRNRTIEKGDITPIVSFIITAHNEERRIGEKIRNTLEQDYPIDQLEILVASDCSTDKTDEIVRSFQSQGIKLTRSPQRRGKENAQKYAVDIACGEIMIFSDVATILKSNGIKNIVKNFNDPTVGCVSSVDRFMDPEGKISGEGAYVKYEMFLRNLETEVGTLVGLSGSFFAARKKVCQDWAVDLQSDFNTLINSVKMGLRGVLCHESVGYYNNIADEKKEYERKVRTVLRGISVLMRSLPMLNVLKYGFFSMQLFSHKLCRWLVPFALILVFMTNAFLISYWTLYLYTFILQCVFYVTALIGISVNFRKSIFKLPSFFVLANLSIFDAWYRYFRQERMVTWNPSIR
jgi:cellulose synthase/poly-beta-1,6-N-acetylglucosamine synthase-like glycosyltransferase